MKSTRLAVLFSALVFLFSFSSASAESGCGGYDSPYLLHCTYFYGLPNSAEGRYIKIQAVTPMYEASRTMCQSNNSATEDHTTDATPGENNITYFICQDKAGTDCQQLGSEHYTVLGEYDNYHLANPVNKFYNIDLSSVAANFKACKPLF